MAFLPSGRRSLLEVTDNMSITWELVRSEDSRGSWVAQSVERLTLGFGSGHDFMVHEFQPHVWLCTDNANPADRKSVV